MSVEAFPLRWPEGWPRTAPHRRSDDRRFWRQSERSEYGYRRGSLTANQAYNSLVEEMRKIGAKNVVVSSNVAVRNDGGMIAKSAERRHDDLGVAIYFTRKGKSFVMAQDAFETIAGNLRSLALAIDAMRTLERHGGGTMMERAFDGFSALPPPAGAKPKRPRWQVLRFPESEEDRELLSVGEIEARYRTLAKKMHPDMGGSDEEMAELNEARTDALEAIEGSER